MVNTMTNAKPKLVGLNHIALEVGDVDEALRFCGEVFSFELRASLFPPQALSAACTKPGIGSTPT
jgi:catechol 2,3-dioxygenase-like lactoylglutathione lyase family enzyme